MGFLGAVMHVNSGLKEKLKTKKDIHLTRKIWHFSGVMFIAVLYNNLTRQEALTAVIVCAALALATDLARLNIPKVNQVFVKLASSVMRERERNNFNGTTALLFGVFIIVYLFPERIVKLSLFFLAIADPIASYYGVKYGKDKILGDKSLQGTTAAFVSCTIIAAVFYYSSGLMTERILIVSLLTGLIGAFSEAINAGKLDDNLTFPVINSILLFFLFNVFGGL